MAEYRICFSIANEFGAELKFEATGSLTYEEVKKSINKEKVAEMLMLNLIGYSADDIEVITPEEYDAEFGERKEDARL